MKIIRGKQQCAKKCCIYGPEGIGKSTFASHFPDPLFIDTEGGTKEMDVARTEKPSSWPMLLSMIEEIRKDPSICKTLIIDTVDWAEQLCIEHILNKYQKSGLESFGYGSGYVYVKEEFGRFLNKLSDVVEAGINVVLVAHAQIRKFEQPNEMGAYDRWELKLGKKTSSQTAPLVKEWADMLLFANYETFSVAVDDKGKKHKAQGGKRVMYTSHHPCWDAKNRYGLPDKMDFDYAGIAHIIESSGQKTVSTPEPIPETTQSVAEENQVTAQNSETNSNPKLESIQETAQSQEVPTETNEPDKSILLDERIPKALRDLMSASHVCEWDLENVMEAKGYVPSGTKIWEYDKVNPGITYGLIIPLWEQIVSAIDSMKKTESIPF